MAKRVRKKKARHHDGHHGGSWKVAYADFVTAMMALFLVLWLVAQGDQRLKVAIANYFRQPGAFDTVKGNIFKGEDTGSKEGDNKLTTILSTRDDEKALYSTAALLRKKLSQLASKDRIKVDMTDEGLHIQILDKADRASFPSGSAELEPATRDILHEIASTICELPNPIQVGGHTDSYTFASPNYTNWELSTDRANAARRELEAECVQPERIRRVVGYADTKPLIADDHYAPANRRISIMLLYLKVAAQESNSATDRPETSETNKAGGPADDESETPKSDKDAESEVPKSDKKAEPEASKSDKKAKATDLKSNRPQTLAKNKPAESDSDQSVAPNTGRPRKVTAERNR